MSKVAIVTDSTAYIPSTMTRGHQIQTVPLQLIWGPQSYSDGVDISPDEFYTRLPNSKDNPTTSQPSPAAFKQVYSSLLEQGYDILSVHISSKLSGTMDSAIQARDLLPGAPIELVDSLTISLAMGFPIMLAARAAEQGATLQDCKRLVQQSLPNTGVLFTLKTLEYLHRGGRIGGAAALVGNAFNLKPILELRNGRIEAAEKVRTMNKAVDRMLDLFEERIAGRTPLHIAVLHAQAEAEAVQLLERARQRFNISSITDAVIAPVSPVVGVHTGPGCLGMAFLAGM